MTLTFDLPLVTVRLSPVHRGGPAVAQDFDPSGIYIRGGGGGQRSLVAEITFKC